MVAALIICFAITVLMIVERQLSQKQFELTCARLKSLEDESLAAMARDVTAIEHISVIREDMNQLVRLIKRSNDTYV